MKILIRLGNQLLSNALRELLNGEQEGCDLVAFSETEQLCGLPPDGLVVDARMLTTGETVSLWPGVKLILIDTGLQEEEIIDLLCNFKIDGIISTDTDSELFKKALTVVCGGQAWIDNSTVRALLNRIETTTKVSVKDSLSNKEQAIILHISQGLTNREIAEKLFISEQTVKAHLSRIFRKCNVKNRAQLVPLAMMFRQPVSN
jgi:LuxR family transcriptional regulator, positive regulator of biofilm formation